MNKRFKICIFIVLIISFFIINSNIDSKDIKGKESLVLMSTNIYVMINGEKVEYYRIAENEILDCEYISKDGKSYFCSWHFDKKREPLWGWVSAKDVVFNYKNK